MYLTVNFFRYTDITRKKKRPIDDVYLPPGWRWKTDWELAPEVVEFDPEEALDCVVEEIWENERYIPFKVHLFDFSPLFGLCIYFQKFLCC